MFYYAIEHSLQSQFSIHQASKQINVSTRDNIRIFHSSPTMSNIKQTFLYNAKKSVEYQQITLYVTIKNQRWLILVLSTERDLLIQSLRR